MLRLILMTMIFSMGMNTSIVYSQAQPAAPVENTSNNGTGKKKSKLLQILGNVVTDAISRTINPNTTTTPANNPSNPTSTAVNPRTGNWNTSTNSSEPIPISTPVNNAFTPVNNAFTPVENAFTPVQLSKPANNAFTPVQLSTPVNNAFTPVQLSTPVNNAFTPVQLSTPVNNASTPVQLSTPINNVFTPVQVSTPGNNGLISAQMSTPVLITSNSHTNGTQVKAASIPAKKATSIKDDFKYIAPITTNGKLPIQYLGKTYYLDVIVSGAYVKLWARKDPNMCMATDNLIAYFKSSVKPISQNNYCDAKKTFDNISFLAGCGLAAASAICIPLSGATAGATVPECSYVWSVAPAAWKMCISGAAKYIAEKITQSKWSDTDINIAKLVGGGKAQIGDVVNTLVDISCEK